MYNHKHALYATWREMLARCYDRRRLRYKRYGDKGTRVCYRWRSSFRAFAIDMGARPHGTILALLNPNGHYTLANTAFMTTEEHRRHVADSLGTSITHRIMTYTAEELRFQNYMRLLNEAIEQYGK